MNRPVSDPVANACVHIFAGPSLHGTALLRARPAQDAEGTALVWHPPARRGDAERLLASHAPGVMALADGTFHSFPAIGHVELRMLLQAGWRVFGLCSMGALRACELQHVGMRPWGCVAQGYVARPETPDDEVALVHGADEPWFPLSEPLVHMREFLAQAVSRQLLSLESQNDIADQLQRRWYGTRTLAELRRLVLEQAKKDNAAALEGLLRDFGPYRLKQRDLQDFIAQEPWRTEGLAPLPSPSTGVPAAFLPHRVS